MRRTSPFFWLVIGVLAIASVLLLARSDSTVLSDVAGTRLLQAIALTFILLMVIVGIMARGPFGKAIRYGLIWASIMVVALVGYTYRFEIGEVAERVFAEVFPGEPTIEASEDGRSVTIARAPRATHFSAVATVNNAPIDMLIDTGASVVTLSYEDALYAGIRARGLRYSVTVSTANGPARAAPVILDQVAIGPIVERRVAALVAEEGMLETSLLGLNFLNELSSYTISGNKMTLTR